MKLNKLGFTLIELVVVIGILALLFTITLVALNPARQFGRANDTKRHSDIVQMSNGIYQNIAEHAGVFVSGGNPFPIPLTPAPIASGGLGNICAALLPNYMPALPQDPQSNNGADITSCTSYDTGYVISKNPQNEITVSAPLASVTISVKR